MAYTAIDKSELFFNTKLYTGNGGNQTITGVGFKPDWTWFKSRDAGNSHALVDIVTGTNKVLYSDSNSSQQSISAQTFNSDGYALVQDGGANSINSNGSTKVGWSWLAGGSQGSSNTNGSINTTYTSANTTSGFSISTYTGNGNVGATVGHGLGAVPEMIIVKRLNGASDWMVYHKNIGNNYRLRLNTTAAEQDNPVWNDTTPTSSLFYMNDNGDANASGGTYVAYCFAPKKGYSKMGIYKGNGNADGPYVDLGFSPAFTLIKRVSGGTESWYINDNKRLGYNPNHYYLLPNDPAAEGSSTSLKIDLLSNGFKIRNTDTSYNTTGSLYVYMSFASAPFVNSSGIPTTAGV